MLRRAAAAAWRTWCREAGTPSPPPPGALRRGSRRPVPAGARAGTRAAFAAAAVAAPGPCASPAASLTMPGRNKAKYTCSCPDLQPGAQEAGESGRAAHLAADESEEEGGGRRGGPLSNVGDPAIIKSPSDPKQYRYIKLRNGLQALLISDLSNTDSKSGEATDDEEEEEDNDDDEDSGAEIEDDDEEGLDDEDDFDDEDEHDDDDLDTEDNELEELDERLEGKKKTTEKQSAAALCVGVGSFADPEDLPGLAHFLEHMVFMGSLKYPDENGFDAFLKKHGGSDNASTDCERTVFQFDVQRKYFKEALDRWAQFFIHPLMIRDAIDREVEAVDSEYQLARPSDANRKEMLFGSLARPGHPMGKFFWGNAETLKHDPKRNNIDTHARLREFWLHYYSAHYMTLVVQSKETLDTLEKWVTEIFSNIPNNGLPKPNFGHLTDPFDTPAFNKLYRGL